MDKVKATIGIQLDYPGEEMSISKEFVVAGDTVTWDELCEQFFMLVGGLGYQLPGSPQELTTILNMEHQKQMKEKYGISI